MTLILFLVILKLLFVVELTPGWGVAGLQLEIYNGSCYPPINTPVELSCTGHGYLGRERLAWRKDGRQIAEWPLPAGEQAPNGYELSDFIVHGGFFAYLNILSFDADQNGVYQCQLQRDGNARSTSNTVELAMEQSPSEQYPECSVRTVGDSKVFICESETSRPQVSLQWWRDGRPLEQPASYEDAVGFVKVHLPVVDDESSRGRFECFLTFKGRLFGTCSMDRPDVAITTSTTDLSIGQKLDVTCIASGNPTPRVSWSWDRDLQASFRAEGSILHIYNISARDDGIVITCEGQNALGSNQTSTVIALRPHQTTAKLEQIRVPTSVGELAQFRCRAISPVRSPNLECIWHYKGVLVNPSNTTDRFIVEDGSGHVLTIVSISIEDVGASVSCLIVTSNRPMDRLLLQAGFPLTTKATTPLTTEATTPLKTEATTPLTTEATTPLTTEATTVHMIPVTPKSDTSSNALNINLNSMGYIIGGLVCLLLTGVCCLVLLRARSLHSGRRGDRKNASEAGVVCNRLNNSDLTVDICTPISPMAESSSPVTKELLMEQESPYEDLDDVFRQRQQDEYQRLISNIWMPPPVSPAFCHET